MKPLRNFITPESVLFLTLSAFVLVGLAGNFHLLMQSESAIYVLSALFGLSGICVEVYYVAKREGVAYFLPLSWQEYLFQKFVLFSFFCSFVFFCLLDDADAGSFCVSLRTPLQVMYELAPDTPMPVTLSMASLGYQQSDV